MYELKNIKNEFVLQREADERHLEELKQQQQFQRRRREMDEFDDIGFSELRLVDEAFSAQGSMI